MTLDERSQAALHAIVEAYIANAQPVSSREVVRRLRHRKISSATVRSVMADLERQGLLQQPHTSAGRIPTERGLRIYLDTMDVDRVPKLRTRDRTRLERTTSKTDPVDFATALGQNLAGLSGLVAMVAAPRFLGTRVREVGLTRIDARRFVAFFISPGGVVQQKLIDVDFELQPEQLQRAQNYLNERLDGRTVAEVREMIRHELEDQLVAFDTAHRRALEIIACALPAVASEKQLDVIVEGTVHLVGQPEFSDVGRLRDLLEAMEEKTTLLKLLDRILDSSGVKVILGSEHRVREVPELTCVGGAWLGPSGDNIAVGVLGPARMDYGRLVPLVDYATLLFGRYWETI